MRDVSVLVPFMWLLVELVRACGPAVATTIPPIRRPWPGIAPTPQAEVPFRPNPDETGSAWSRTPLPSQPETRTLAQPSVRAGFDESELADRAERIVSLGVVSGAACDVLKAYQRTQQLAARPWNIPAAQRRLAAAKPKLQGLCPRLDEPRSTGLHAGTGGYP